jgi:cytochrome c551/c552
MNKVIFLFAFAVFLYACSGNTSNQPASNNTTSTGGDLMKEDNSHSPDPNRGIGKFTNVEVSPTLDTKMAAAGKVVSDLKCMSCHKLTDEKLVGPGWKDVTKRRTAEWIMNFVTNTDEMISKDPEAQAMLTICLVRMPNQNLSDDEARSVYEYMRQNDGVK